MKIMTEIVKYPHLLLNYYTSKTSKVHEPKLRKFRNFYVKEDFSRETLEIRKGI